MTLGSSRVSNLDERWVWSLPFNEYAWERVIELERVIFKFVTLKTFEEFPSYMWLECVSVLPLNLLQCENSVQTPTQPHTHLHPMIVGEMSNFHELALGVAENSAILVTILSSSPASTPRCSPPRSLENVAEQESSMTPTRLALHTQSELDGPAHQTNPHHPRRSTQPFFSHSHMSENWSPHSTTHTTSHIVVRTFEHSIHDLLSPCEWTTGENLSSQSYEVDNMWTMRVMWQDYIKVRTID